jgi:GcrA cell cycle regulator
MINMQSNWAAEHCRALREHFTRGLSYSEIAAAINAEFKTTYTRNATIGRAKRMGIAVSNRPKTVPKHLPAKQLPSKVQVPPLRRGREVRASDIIWPIPVFAPAQLPKLRCVETDPRHLSLAGLEAGDCRYPYGGDEDGEIITFCGHPQREGSSYCAPHFHLTRGPGALYRRPTASAALRLVEGGMKRDLEPKPESTAVRMDSLSRRHRIAHLRALILQLPADSTRRAKLAALLSNEMIGCASREGRAI